MFCQIVRNAFAIICLFIDPGEVWWLIPGGFCNSEQALDVKTSRGKWRSPLFCSLLVCFCSWVLICISMGWFQKIIDGRIILTVVVPFICITWKSLERLFYQATSRKQDSGMGDSLWIPRNFESSTLSCSLRMGFSMMLLTDPHNRDFMRFPPMYLGSFHVTRRPRDVQYVEPS